MNFFFKQNNQCTISLLHNLFTLNIIYCMLLFILYIVNRDSNTGTRQYLNRPPKFLAHQTSSYCYRLINIGQCARNKFANSIWFPPIFECFAQVGENENYCVYSLEFYCIYKFMNFKKKTYIDVLLNSVYKQNHHDIDIIQNIIPSN